MYLRKIAFKDLTRRTIQKRIVIKRKLLSLATWYYHFCLLSQFQYTDKLLGRYSYKYLHETVLDIANLYDKIGDIHLRIRDNLRFKMLSLNFSPFIYHVFLPQCYTKFRSFYTASLFWNKINSYIIRNSMCNFIVL